MYGARGTKLMYIKRNQDDTFSVISPTVMGAKLYYSKSTGRFLNPDESNDQKFTTEQEAQDKLTELESN